MDNRPHPRPASRPAGSADEVEAHSMKDDRPHPNRPWHGVAFDPDKEEYQRID